MTAIQCCRGCPAKEAAVAEIRARGRKLREVDPRELKEIARSLLASDPAIMEKAKLWCGARYSTRRRRNQWGVGRGAGGPGIILSADAVLALCLRCARSRNVAIRLAVTFSSASSPDWFKVSDWQVIMGRENVFWFWRRISSHRHSVVPEDQHKGSRLPHSRGLTSINGNSGTAPLRRSPLLR